MFKAFAKQLADSLKPWDPTSLQWTEVTGPLPYRVWVASGPFGWVFATEHGQIAVSRSPHMESEPNSPPSPHSAFDPDPFGSRFHSPPPPNHPQPPLNPPVYGPPGFGPPGIGPIHPVDPTPGPPIWGPPGSGPPGIGPI